MERICIKLVLLSFFVFLQCASSTQKEAENAADTTTVVSSQPEAISLSDQTTEEPEYAFDLDEFTKHPFANDYPYIKSLLRQDSIAFTITTQDTIDSEQRAIVFDSSRIDFLDSDPRFQDELGDLICSSDIRSPKFQFNQGITIGMSQEEFFTLANMDETTLMDDAATGYKYLKNEISFEDDGHWGVTIWFKAGLLVRIQSEISPCYYDYGD